MTDGLMFPKPERKKKKKHHPKSIIPGEKGRCFLCIKLYGDYSWKPTERHHVFYGPLKNISEEHGFTCHLCQKHHRGVGKCEEAVHSSKKMRKYLCAIFQAEYEKTHTREEFIKLIGENYLEEEETDDNGQL